MNENKIEGQDEIQTEGGLTDRADETLLSARKWLDRYIHFINIGIGVIGLISLIMFGFHWLGIVAIFTFFNLIVGFIGIYAINCR